MPEKGLEPPRRCRQWILNPPRLPFRHSGIYDLNRITFYHRGIFASRRNFLKLAGIFFNKYRKFERKQAFAEIFNFIGSHICKYSLILQAYGAAQRI